LITTIDLEQVFWESKTPQTQGASHPGPKFFKAVMPAVRASVVRVRGWPSDCYSRI